MWLGSPKAWLSKAARDGSQVRLARGAEWEMIQIETPPSGSEASCCALRVGPLLPCASRVPACLHPSLGASE